MSRYRIVVFALVPASIALACGQRDVALEAPPAPRVNESSTPSFEADASSPEASSTPAGLCPSNTCPDGRTTCPNNPFPCAVDLLSDDDNCGACGRHCPRDEAYKTNFGSVTRCIEGKCARICNDGWADCNGRPEDGCETRIVADKNNCGGCGVTCADVCTNGSCGCPNGQTYCAEPKSCNYLDTDNTNCGTCGNVCPDVPQPPPAWNAVRGCNGGQCATLACNWGRLDCNGDLGDEAGNGCETNADNDPNNCGACGNVCDPGQSCLNATCLCPAGSVLCLSKCVQLDDDIDNCGACGNRCIGERTAPGAVELRGQPTCEGGVGGYECAQDWGDCDGDVVTGCETNFLDDPLNCGGCGIRCVGIEGQACINGQCAMKPCDEVK